MRSVLSEPARGRACNVSAAGRSHKRMSPFPAAWGPATRSNGSVLMPNTCTCRRFNLSRNVSAASAQGEPQTIRKTVAETRRAFHKAFPYPILGAWGVIVGELLAQQHLYRYHRRYRYTAVGALGLVSVFDQVLEGYPNPEQRDQIFGAFFEALDEDGEQYRRDSKEVSAAAEEAGSVENLLNSEYMTALKESVGPNALLQTKWMSIGLFRVLEAVKSPSPKALNMLAEASGLSIGRINSDLGTYKSVLSKLQAAREMQAEMIAREKRKKEEAAKEAEAAGKGDGKGETEKSTEGTPQPGAAA